MFGKRAARIAELEQALERKEQARIELRLEVNALTEQLNKLRRRHADVKAANAVVGLELAREAVDLLRFSPQFRDSDPAKPAYSWEQVAAGMRRLEGELGR